MPNPFHTVETMTSIDFSRTDERDYVLWSNRTS